MYLEKENMFLWRRRRANIKRTRSWRTFCQGRHFKTFEEDAGATSMKLKRDLYILCRVELEDIV